MRDQRAKTKPSDDRYFWVVIFLLVSLFYLAGINRPLRDAESKYAEIPREMLVTGDWLTPHLDFARYFTKPPLTFWVTAVAYTIFGVHPWVARLTNILWALSAALLMGILASQMYGEKTGRIAPVVFLLTAEVYTYCLDAGIEFGLITCIILSLTAFWIFLQTGKKLYLRLFYLGLALSFLAKGILGIALPASISGLFIIAGGRIRDVKRFIDPAGFVILALGVLPWSIVMMSRHPDFFKVFVINEHFGAFLGKRDSNDALFPTGLFLALGAGEFFPWIMYLPIIVKSVFTSIRKAGKDREKVIFLMIWFFVPLVLFSLSKSKVDFYCMHCYPPMLILLASELERLFSAKTTVSVKLWAYPWCLVSILALIALLFLKTHQGNGLIRDLDIPSLEIAYRFLIGSALLGFVIFWLFNARRPRSAFVAIAIFMAFLFVCTQRMFVAAYPEDSMKFAADTYNRVAEGRYVLFTDEPPEFAHVAILPFYTGKVAYLLRDRKGSKLYFYMKDRMRLCYDEDEFRKKVIEEKKVFLVGKIRKTVERLKRLGLGYRILAKSDAKAFFEVQAIPSSGG